MKANKLAHFSFGLSLLSAGGAFAQTATTDPVGFVSVTAKANSDVVLAVPMNRPAEFKGVISTLSGTSGTVTLTVSGTPGWTTNVDPALAQFAPLVSGGKTYALQIATGVKEGLTIPITTNGTNSVTFSVDPNDDLTGVIAGGASADSIDIVPYWTLGTLFAPVPTGSMELQFYASDIAGTNLPPTTIFELAGSNWLNQDSGANSNNVPLQFGVAYLARNNGVADVVLSFVGSVPMSKHRRLLQNLAAAQQQDVRVGFSAPVPQSVGSISIGQTAGDELHIYDNSATGQNKSPAQILEFTAAGTWLDQDTGGNVSATLMLLPGQGYLLRRSGANSTNPFVWTALQGYLQ